MLLWQPELTQLISTDTGITGVLRASSAPVERAQLHAAAAAGAADQARVLRRNVGELVQYALAQATGRNLARVVTAGHAGEIRTLAVVHNAQALDFALE